MIETPFLGDKYNYIMPGIMLGFSFIFLLMSYFKYETKMVEILRRYNSRQDSIQTTGQDETEDVNAFESARSALMSSSTSLNSTTSSVKPEQKKKKPKKISKMTKTEIESLLRGEIVFLKEIKAQRDRAMRKRKISQKKSIKEIIAKNERKQSLRSDILGSAFAFEPKLLNASEEASLLVSDRGARVRHSIEGSFE